MNYEPRRTTPTRFASFLAIVLMLAACGSPSVPTIVGYKLSGTVMLQTPNGVVPGSHVTVQGPSRRNAITDARGRYSMYGLEAGVAHIRIDFSAFETIEQDIPIAADTVADFQLTPRPLFALSGRITEMTSTGPVPVSGVGIDVVLCPPTSVGATEFKAGLTDADGAYRIDGLCEGSTAVYLYKPGYDFTPAAGPHCDDGHGTECRWVTIAGDTRFDLVLVRK